MKTTIIIPTYNESENLPRLVSALFNLPVPDMGVIVIDDNSTDGTGEIADKLAAEHPGRLQVIHRSGKLGLGSAYITGMQAALQGDSRVIGQMDADFSHEPSKIIELLQALKTCDISVGSRYVIGGSVDKDWPYWRKWLSGFGNWYARTILNLPIRDTTGGYRLWKRSVLEAMPLSRVKSNGYVFMVEMAYMAHKLGFTFGEVPIYFAERQCGQSKMSFGIQLEAALRVWALLWQYRDLRPIR